jgi:hypothetical protein
MDAGSAVAAGGGLLSGTFNAIEVVSLLYLVVSLGGQALFHFDPISALFGAVTPMAADFLGHAADGLSGLTV